MDKETLHRILVNPTRTGLDKVEKEVARFRGVNDVLRQELTTWKNAVAARNETIEDLSEQLEQRGSEVVRLHHELDEAATIVADDKKKDAVQVEGLRIHVEAAHSTLTEIFNRLSGIVGAIDQTEALASSVRDSIARDQKIDYTEELRREAHNAHTE